MRLLEFERLRSLVENVEKSFAFVVGQVALSASAVDFGAYRLQFVERRRVDKTLAKRFKGRGAEKFAVSSAGVNRLNRRRLRFRRLGSNVGRRRVARRRFHAFRLRAFGSRERFLRREGRLDFFGRRRRRVRFRRRFGLVGLIPSRSEA